MKARSVLMAGVAATMFYAVAANATPVTFSGYANGSSTVSLVSPFTANVSAGEFSLTAGGIPMTSFCIELSQSLSFGQTRNDYQFSALDGSVSALQLGRFSRLYENYYDVSRTDKASTAAFQTAIWEIMNDGNGTLDLGLGNFSISGTSPASVASLASGWLANLDQQSAGQWSFQRLGSDGWQDQVVASRVPLPGTLALVAIAGFGMVAGNRSRSKRAPVAASS